MRDHAGARPGWATLAEFEGTGRMGYTPGCVGGWMRLWVCDEGVGLGSRRRFAREQVWVRWEDLDRPWICWPDLDGSQALEPDRYPPQIRWRNAARLSVSRPAIGWGCGPIDSYAFCPSTADWIAVVDLWASMCPRMLAWDGPPGDVLAQPRTFDLPLVLGESARAQRQSRSPGELLFRLPRLAWWPVVLVFLVMMPQMVVSWAPTDPRFVWLMLAMVETWAAATVVLELVIRRATRRAAAASARPFPVTLLGIIGVAVATGLGLAIWAFTLTAAKG